MAYPYQVDTGNTLRLTANTTRNQGPGLYRRASDGAYFSFFRDRVTNTIKAQKSINRGVSWSVVDNANSKPIATEPSAPARSQYATALDPVGSANLIWVAWVPPTSPTSNPHLAAFASFNLTTEQWGATVTGGPDMTAVGSPDMVLGMRVPTLGQGQPVLFYRGPDEGGFGRCYYVDLPISLGIWGIPTRLNDSAGEGEHYSAMLGAPMGSDGRIHAVVLATAGSDKIKARSISRTGLKGSWTTLATEAGGESIVFGTPFASTDGSMVGVPYSHGPVALGATWRIKLQTAASAQEPTWSEQTVLTDIYEQVSGGNATGVFLGSNLFVAWIGPSPVFGATPLTYYYIRKQSGFWGAKTTLYNTGSSTAISQLIAAYPVSGGVGAFFDFGATPGDSPWAPWYWELRTAGNMNSILGASRQPKVV